MKFNTLTSIISVALMLAANIVGLGLFRSVTLCLFCFSLISFLNTLFLFAYWIKNREYETIILPIIWALLTALCAVSLLY